MSHSSIESEVRATLDAAPTRDGGAAIVIATASSPPALALLSTGDVLWQDDRFAVGIYAGSSAVAGLNGAFTALIPLGDRAARVEVVEATASVEGPLARIEGRVSRVRPTAEPPWMLTLSFRPVPADDPRVDEYVSYWRDVRAWLAGEIDSPPQPPA